MPSFAVSLKEQIKQSVDIVQLIGEHVALQRAGRLYKALCPFHDDHRPSLQVDPDRQIFKCYPCGKGGDVISFVQEIERVEFGEALRILAERAGISLQATGGAAPKSEKSELYEVVAWAAKQFHECLLQDAAAGAVREYLEQRGIDADSITRFALGYHPNDWEWILRRARARRYSPALLERVGLVKQRQQGGGHYDQFVDRLMFPIRDTRGRAVAFGARLLPWNAEKHPAKYLNSAETPLFTKREMLYGFDLARPAVGKCGTAVLVEGYTDCIIAHRFGMSNVIASLGTALTEQHIQVLKRHAKQIVLVFDGDEAGKRAAERALELFIGHELDVRICTLAGGEDPCDILQKSGREALERQLERAPDVLDYVLGGIEEQFNLTSTHGRHLAAQEFARLVGRSPRLSSGYESSRRMREWIVFDKVAQRLRIPEAALREEISRARGKGLSVQNMHVAAQPAPRFDPLERELLEIVLVEPSCLDEVAREVPLELLGKSPLRDLLAKFYELAKAGERASFSRLIAELEDLELKRLVTDLEASGRHNGNVEERLEAVLSQIRRRKQQRQAQELQHQLRQSPPSEEDEMDILRKFAQSKRAQQQIV